MTEDCLSCVPDFFAWNLSRHHSIRGSPFRTNLLAAPLHTDEVAPKLEASLPWFSTMAGHEKDRSRLRRPLPATQSRPVVSGAAEHAEASAREELIAARTFWILCGVALV